MKPFAALRIVTALALMSVLGLAAQAGPPVQRSVFDFECAETEVFQAANLSSVISKVVSRLPPDGGTPVADRAVASDLDADGKVEFLVPLVCGPTCNCTWAILGGTPVHELGQIDGCIIRVQRASHGHVTVLSYEHMSAMEGMMTTYIVHGGVYTPSAMANVSTDVAIRSLGCDGGKVPCCK